MAQPNGSMKLQINQGSLHCGRGNACAHRTAIEVGSLLRVQLNSCRTHMPRGSGLQSVQSQFDGRRRAELAAVIGEPGPDPTAGIDGSRARVLERRGRDTGVMEHEIPGGIADCSGRPIEDAEFDGSVHELMRRIHLAMSHG